jgi:hypothetical protein
MTADLAALLTACQAAPRIPAYWRALANLFINEAVPLYRRHRMTLPEVERRWPLMADILRHLAWLRALGIVSHHEARQVLRAGFAKCLEDDPCG